MNSIFFRDARKSICHTQGEGSESNRDLDLSVFPDERLLDQLGSLLPPKCHRFSDKTNW